MPGWRSIIGRKKFIEHKEEIGRKQTKTTIRAQTNRKKKYGGKKFIEEAHLFTGEKKGDECNKKSFSMELTNGNARWNGRISSQQS